MRITAFTTLLAALGCILAGCQESSNNKGGTAPAKDPMTQTTLANRDVAGGDATGTKSADNSDADLPRFEAANFVRPTNVDNPWFPLKPGTRFTWEGTSVDDEGVTEPHSVVFTVTDLTKVIGGINTVVCWDQDFVDGELVETELVFFAQDKEGTVWHLGEYPEELDDGKLEDAPCWIHGIKGSKAGIRMQAKPKLGTPSYAQGWAPSVDWTDRGVVYQVGQKTKTPYREFDDVLVIDESDSAEPDSHQLKYYARGVGGVRVGWRGKPAGQENLELTKIEQLQGDELAKAREGALRLDQRGYQNSKEVYALTKPAVGPGGATAKAPAAQPAANAQSTAAQNAQPGTEEFGLTKRELVQAVEKVEALIAKNMREQGFEYVAADYNTVRSGMTADKSLPGMSEEEFIEQHGFGVATLYTGQAPQLSEGYSPARVGLGEKNVQIYKKLSPSDQVAYNRALFGENTDATFAVALENEDFSRCGGATLKAIEQVFKPEQLKATYYNPKDALINKDPRMKAALRKYSEEMRKAGYSYNHPDDVETDIRQRLYAITSGGTVPVDKLSPEQQTALKKLQDDERKVAKINLDLQEEIFEPVEAQIEKELFAQEVK